MDTNRLFDHFVDLTRQHARQAVSQYRAGEQPRQHVYVLLMNGAVLGVLATIQRAESEAKQLRDVYAGDWKGDGHYWFHRELRIELSISTHTVVG